MSTIKPTGYSDLLVQQLGVMRGRLDDLTQQLTTGIRSQTYGGLGVERDLALAYQGRLTKVESYQQTIETLDVRMQVGDKTLTQLAELASGLKGSLDPNSYNLSTTGVTDAQTYALESLNAFTSLLNTDVAGRYIFSGAAIDTEPVIGVDAMLDGADGKAGLRQLIEERRQADQGADGRGRLTLSAVGNTVTLAEDGDHPFGMKLSTVTSTLSNASVTGPTGTPATLDVVLSGQPEDGDVLTVTFSLPDGSTAKIDLEAGRTNDTSAGTFQIGATPDDTAANLANLIDEKIAALGETDLVAASAVQAGNEFFDTEGGGAPKRVDGPPFASATALVTDTTHANTVQWYRGTNDASSARADATARVDTSVVVSYGMRANEEAFSWALRQMAVIVAVDVSGGTATDSDVHSELLLRTKGNLGIPAGVQSIEAVEVEFASASQAATQAAERHKAMSATYQKVVDDTLNTDQTEVVTRLLALQTQMQASYQATSILYKMSLTNYM
ncbi:MAG: flagellar biosynthesis protein FlgL [Siculibacillus sp.]|nr:flagellar biosynthesis protein FlgL [Siculibacillus sp.]